MNQNVIKLLLDCAKNFPDKAIILSGGDSCTYNNLVLEISSCVTYFQSLGVKKGDRVSLLLENSIQYVVAYYAAISCGAVIVPLNTTAKHTDIANWISHSGSTVLIVSKKLSNPLSDDNFESLNIVIVPDSEINSDMYWSSRHASTVDLNELADLISSTMPVTIMYTSGTTGKPKGVTLTHGNFVHNYTEIIRYLNLTSNDSILNILPFYYSYGNSILHTHLMSGATIVIENNFMYPVRTLKIIEDNKLTGFSGVPATFSILLNRTKLSEHNLNSLRYATQAGGAMPPSNIKRFVDQLGNVELYIMYGQTEATARISYLAPSKLCTKLGSVGKPLNGILIEIRGEDGRPVSNGIEGELYVKGPNIMQGYWDNDKLTNQAIIDGFLKTGDLGYMDAEGYVYLTGRRSDMIKVGGHRISPLEIEEVVSQLDGIEEVAATGVDDEILGQVIKLSVVLSNGCQLTELTIKAYCKKNLALYKIPKFINFVESLPKTASGKVKRYLL